ncbi:matrilysin-like [Diabrotica undecimpunctata]|uniref:matrilysin-like n=1 Tax=Diabrotica undecimpunctata TaxID=50387 RepID=UPI003B64011B
MAECEFLVQINILSENFQFVTINLIQFTQDLDFVLITFTINNFVYSEAFARWEKISNLKFTRVIIPSSKPDITITVVSNNHNFRASCQGTSKCSFNFDGPGKVLAHAYYPSANGECTEIHLDANERWYVGNDRAPHGEVNFLAVLMHEIGHSLGLEHSTSDSSIMYAWYHQDVPNFGEDDKKAMSMLYGPKTVPSYIPSTSTTPVTQARTISQTRSNLPKTPALTNRAYLP